MFVLGGICTYLVLHLFRPDGVAVVDIKRLFAVCYLAGYFGARFWSWLVDGSGESFVDLMYLGPMTLYGGLFGSMIAGGLYIRSRSLPLRALLEVTIPAGIIGVGIGRIGCFLNGDDYGFIMESHFFNRGLRFPVQLLESVYCITLGTLVVFSRPFATGYNGTTCLGLYACFRFFVEFLRADPRGWIIEGILTPGQLLSIVILLILAFFRGWLFFAES